MRHDIAIDEEDSLDVRSSHGVIDVCVIQTPTMSNFTDLSPLGHHPGVGVRYERVAARVGRPDLLVLPGSKNTEADTAWLHDTGLGAVVRALAEHGTPILGLCGGYQMLGRRVGAVRGLGLLPVDTDYRELKEVHPSEGLTSGRWLLPPGLAVRGYEIHQGVTDAPSPLVGTDGAVVELLLRLRGGEGAWRSGGVRD